MEIPRGRGFQKPNFFNESMTLKGNFWRGGGFNLKNLPWEGYGYFLEQHNLKLCFYLKINILRKKANKLNLESLLRMQ